MKSKEIGLFAENIAARFLQKRGYNIIKRNHRKPWGEIDIIAKRNKVIVFVEVKSNNVDFKGDFQPELRVNKRKLDKIIKTASLYLEFELKVIEPEWRVDILSITFFRTEKKARIKHFMNVAEATF